MNFKQMLDEDVIRPLIVINLVFFALQFFIGNFTDIFVLNPKLFLSEPWRLISSMFLHGSVSHILFNMYALFMFGPLVQQVIGPKKFLQTYFATGLIAAIAHIIFSNSLALGASGAIFGLMGVLIILTPDLKVYMMLIPVPIKMKYAVPGMLVLIWIISAGVGLSIGNIAHLGGMISGLLIGLYLKKVKKVSVVMRY
ncbi:rhomboid family intramembrane serine protease [Candidatus Woesearchaeota archaeon]|nr:rhomboid family intramembrane serine protease [Candidatus Woesearchaeota archaeon]